MIPIAKPLIGSEEIDSVISVLKSGVIAEGQMVKEFEKEFAAYVGALDAVAVSSGTAALHLALLALGIGPGDEVITTPFSFIATANTVLYAGARPVFADVEPDTFCINPEAIKKKISKRTKAIIPVDLYGHPADFDAISDIAGDKIHIIDDACQAHGAIYKGRKVGSIGAAACFSFYPTKNMTTGEGGIITTNDSKVAEKARMLRAHGMKVRYYHEMLGYNFRMTDIGAAIGLSQLKKVEEFNERRVRNAAMLTRGLNGIDGIITPVTRPGCRHVFHQYTVRITREFGVSRDDVVKALTDRGIGAGVFYPLPIHMQPLYRQLGYNEHLPVSEMLSTQVVSLPVHPSVTEADIREMTSVIRGLQR